MKYSVCVVTGSRAEYGLLYPLLLKIEAEESFALNLVVTGSHLSKAFGGTQAEIENSGIAIQQRVFIALDGDSKADMVKATGVAMSLFAEYFSNNYPDLLLILGDRYEIFAAASAAAMLGIPIAHLHGGETTEGAVDEFLRHAITKMSFLHFVACEEYRRRVVQLGEAPERVFNVGALGVENIKNIPLLPPQKLQQSLNFDITGKPLSIVTFHPVTLENNTSEQQIYELIQVLDKFPEMNYLITKANADAGGRIINQIWEREAGMHDNWLVVASLGLQRYLSALKYATMMIGNSSSGIIEAPAMGLPTVNIGDRQKGRIMADSIICCPAESTAIESAMKKALSASMQNVAKTTKQPFGTGNTSKQIIDILKKYFASNQQGTKKKFFDLEVKI